MSSRVLGAVAVAAVALVSVTGCSDDSDGGDADGDPPTRSERGADVAVPTVTGPVEGGAFGVPRNPTPPEILEEHGYVEEEYFLAGTATSYTSAEALAGDGMWDVTDSETADYTTRIVVRRPADPDEFDGTVVVEWLNVTSGMDADPDWGFTKDEIMASGSAYVIVSAQQIGVEGGPPLIEIEGVEISGLKPMDPERYGELSHPGDEYSYDIFSQAAQALLRPEGVDPLDGLVPTELVAVGESQSASRLVSYINAVHPVADIYDGFLVHSRGGNSAALDAATIPPNPTLVRTDLDDPVLIFQTETDLFGLGSFEARQPDTDGIVTWEVAGTAHADLDTLVYGFESARVWTDQELPDFEEQCGGPLNDGGQQYTLRAAMAGLMTWVRGGDSVPAAELLETTTDEEGGTVIARDDLGNALGGVRTTFVDVPTAIHDGEPREGASIICILFGATTPFPPDQLAALYPSNEDYVTAVGEAADRLVEERFLLPADRDRLVERAEQADVP